MTHQNQTRLIQVAVIAIGCATTALSTSGPAVVLGVVVAVSALLALFFWGVA